MPYLYTSDAYSPREIAAKVEEVGVLKAQSRFLPTFMLGMMAGGFIGLGGLLYSLVFADPHLSPAVARLLGGLLFGTGYMIAILAGAELFTSNNLLAMAIASGKITARQLGRNWAIVLSANAVGAIGLGVLFLLSGIHREMDGAIGKTAYLIGVDKVSLPLLETFARAILGNLFVCIAVWISIGGRTVTDKVVGGMLPLIALGALSLDHVLASLYYVPRSLLMAEFLPEYVCPEAPVISLASFGIHLLVVIGGNIIGGGVMVAVAYHVIYRRHQPGEETRQ